MLHFSHVPLKRLVLSPGDPLEHLLCQYFDFTITICSSCRALYTAQSTRVSVVFANRTRSRLSLPGFRTRL